MASFPLHTIPSGEQQDIVSELSLVSGIEYEFQNRGGSSIRVYDTGAAAPPSINGKEVDPGDYFTFTAGSDPVWVWGVDGPAILAYDDRK